MECIGLRYFNVFGSRQGANGVYASFISKWFDATRSLSRCFISWGGETSRGFSYIANTIQVNLLEETTNNLQAIDEIYNIAFGARTTLNQLHDYIRDLWLKKIPDTTTLTPHYRDFRDSDMRHSLADITKVTTRLSYVPSQGVRPGLSEMAKRLLSTLPSGEQLPQEIG